MKTITDIDLDFADREAALSDLMHIPASQYQDGDLRKHVVGVYFQSIPQDPLTGVASIEYKAAEARGYFKIDFLNLSVYKGVRDEAHLDDLISREPMWEMLESPEIVEQLFHLSGHFPTVQAMQPRSIMQLAMVLAMIRPAKRHLIGKSWPEVEQEIWTVPESDAYSFKKAHSVSYAMVLVVQMNLLWDEAIASASAG
jgi:hypothetical protein